MKCMTTVRNLYISTHALTEGDLIRSRFGYFVRYFNSRPHGGRHSGAAYAILPIGISPHALTEGDLSENIEDD